ncbi:hypothetical protein J4464_04015 [Candidatus Woesearchaeota archaeon]|nr:hypothetical protein [Candidatus Woesearchaeota archaeon]
MQQLEMFDIEDAPTLRERMNGARGSFRCVNPDYFLRAEYAVADKCGECPFLRQGVVVPYCEISVAGRRLELPFTGSDHLIIPRRTRGDHILVP